MVTHVTETSADALTKLSLGNWWWYQGFGGGYANVAERFQEKACGSQAFSFTTLTFPDLVTSLLL